MAEPSAHKILLLACGALAQEVIALREQHSWPVDIFCAPAILHNTPGKIPPAIEKRINELRERYERIIVVYGDCGTGGRLDTALERLGVERIAGPHCYEQYGSTTFNQVMDEQPGTYFLTDFMVRHFDRLIWRGMGLDRLPELRDEYFRNYEQVLYLAQTDDPDLMQRAERAAEKLGLPLRVAHVGYGELETRLIAMLSQNGVSPHGKSGSASHLDRGGVEDESAGG